MPTAIIVNDFGSVTGGATRVAVDSAIGLSASGWKVDYLCCVPPVDPVLRRESISVHTTGQKDILAGPRLSSMVTGIWNRKAAKALDQILERTNPADAVVHIHCFSKCLSASIAKPIAERGFKSVLTLHDYFFACPNGGFFNYQTREHCREKPMSLRCALSNCDLRSRGHKAWRMARQMVQNRFLGRLDGLNFIAPSKYCAGLLEPYLPKNARLFRLDNPVNTEKQPRIKAENNSRIVYVGQLAENKGVRVLAKALDMAGRAGLFIGDGPLAAEIGKRHEVTGWVNGRRVFELMSRARAVVFPSLWHEVRPLVPLEAMSRGIPVIASNRCAATEDIKHGVNGLLFDPGQADQLVLNLERINNNGIAAELSKNGYEKYWQNPMSGQRHALELGKIYKDILKTGQ